MNRDPILEAKIQRAAKRLGDLVGQYARQTDVRMAIFCEDGTPYVIDNDRDSQLSGDRHRGPPYRQDDHEDGGAVVALLDSGDASWSGGGW